MRVAEATNLALAWQIIIQGLNCPRVSSVRKKKKKKKKKKKEKKRKEKKRKKEEKKKKREK